MERSSSFISTGIWCLGGSERNGAVWSDVIWASVWCIWAVTGIPSWSPQETGVQKSPGVALINGFSEFCTYKDQNVSFHQSECGRIKDRNAGIDCHGYQKGCWKIKELSNCIGTVIQASQRCCKKHVGQWPSFALYRTHFTWLVLLL